MSRLETLARAVVANWDNHKLAESVQALAFYLEERDAEKEVLGFLVERARNTHADEDVEVDDDAIFSDPENGEGCWVSGWVWARYTAADRKALGYEPFEFDDEVEETEGA
jgi:hypothetical protein